MSAIEFPYIFHRGFYVPIIPIKLRIGDRWLERWTFVDSGATFSLLHPKAVEKTGIDYQKGQHRLVIVGDGNLLDAYFFRIPVRIEQWEFTCEIGICESFKVGFNVLGRKDVFEQFRVCFSDAKRIVTFHQNNTSS